MAEILELSQQEFKATMIKMRRAIMEKVDVQEQIGNVSREMKTLKKESNHEKTLKMAEE